MNPNSAIVKNIAAQGATAGPGTALRQWSDTMTAREQVESQLLEKLARLEQAKAERITGAADGSLAPDAHLKQVAKESQQLAAEIATLKERIEGHTARLDGLAQDVLDELATLAIAEAAEVATAAVDTTRSAVFAVNALRTALEGLNLHSAEHTRIKERLAEQRAALGGVHGVGTVLPRFPVHIGELRNRIVQSSTLNALLARKQQAMFRVELDAVLYPHSRHFAQELPADADAGEMSEAEMATMATQILGRTVSGAKITEHAEREAV